MQGVQTCSARLSAVPSTQQSLQKVSRVAGTPVVQRSSALALPTHWASKRTLITRASAPGGFAGYGPQGGE
jgi:hypothetical protein